MAEPRSGSALAVDRGAPAASTTAAASTDVRAGSGAASDARSAPTAIPGLTAILEQYREDEILNLLQVKASNRSTSSVDVLDLRLDWAGITGNDPLARGRPRVARPTGRHPDQRRAGGLQRSTRRRRAAAAAPAVAVGHASIDGGPPVLISIPITDSGKILPEDLPAELSRSAGAVGRRGVLRHDVDPHHDERRGAGGREARWRCGATTAPTPITLVRLNGSVLLRLVGLSPSTPAAVLEAGQDSLTVPILIEQSGRCEAHALAESKKTYLIVLDVGIGDEPPIGDEVAFDIPSRVVLGKMINDSCGVG